MLGVPTLDKSHDFALNAAEPLPGPRTLALLQESSTIPKKGKICEELF
jgi:hypothetical protein